MLSRKKQPEPETAKPGKQLAAILEGLEPEEPPKMGHMKATFSKRASGVFFVVAALDLSAFLLGVTVLGRMLGQELCFEIGAQIFAGVLTLLLIKYMDVSYQIGLGFKGFKVGVVALLPLALASAAWMRPLNPEIEATVPLLVALGALTEATWEEACFRGLGVFLSAKEDGRISWFALFGTSLWFGALKLMRLVIESEAWVEILLYAAFSAALGAFLMALYVYSKNLTLPILAHFLFNLAEFEPRRCSTLPPILGEEGSLLMMVTTCVVLVVLAVWLFLRNERKCKIAAAKAAETPAND